jgi:hypothetical protein
LKLEGLANYVGSLLACAWSVVVRGSTGDAVEAAIAEAVVALESTAVAAAAPGEGQVAAY